MENPSILTPDESGNLHCRIKDLERELKWACHFWETDLDSFEERSLDAESVQNSRQMIKQTREFLKKRAD
jgi:hypothetical protein